MQFTRVGLPCLQYIPPPSFAALPEKVQLDTFKSPLMTLLKLNIPPPFSSARLPEKKQFSTIGADILMYIPPPFLSFAAEPFALPPVTVNPSNRVSKGIARGAAVTT